MILIIYGIFKIYYYNVILRLIWFFWKGMIGNGEIKMVVKRVLGLFIE